VKKNYAIVPWALMFSLLGAIFMTPSVLAQIPDGYDDYKGIHQLEWEAHRDVSPAPVPHVWPVRPLAKDKAPLLGREVLGYYPYWVDGYQYMRWDLLTTCAFFSLDADGDGDFTNLHGWPATGIVDMAHANGVRVVVTVVCFNSGDITSILSNPANRQNLIDNLLYQVSAGNADGVNIDFEGVSMGILEGLHRLDDVFSETGDVVIRHN